MSATQTVSETKTAKAKKAAKKAAGTGRKVKFPEDGVIKFTNKLKDEKGKFVNPKKHGSKGWHTFNQLDDGITVGEFKKRMAKLREKNPEIKYTAVQELGRCVECDFITVEKQ